jgi:hypothetical protein
MRVGAWAAALTVALTSARAIAVDPPSPSPAPGAVGDQRLVFSTNGSKLTGGFGAGGGSATWVGNFGGGTAIGVGVDYQQISNSHWTTGDFSASVAPGLQTHLYVEAHEGAGDLGDRAFHYSLLFGGVLEQVNSLLSVQLEERRIDIDTSHGNLPKVGLSLQITPQLLASVSYALSVGGNLGTHLGSARIDYTWRTFSALAGIAGGPAAPAVVNLLPGGAVVVAPGPTLREGFAGLGKPLGRTDWLLIGDYQNVGGTKRYSLSLTCTVHLHAPTPSP